jgi:hypothetical protein
LVDTVDLGSISIFRVLVQVQQKIVMYNFANNVVIYSVSYEKKLFGLVLSVSKGWGLINMAVSLSLISNYKILIFSKFKKSYLHWIESLLLGFHAGYYQYIVLKGMGFKFIHVKDSIILKIGYSHRILFYLSSNILCTYLTKYTLKVNCRSINKLTQLIKFFLVTRKKSGYKKKGIFIKGSTHKIKLSSKKSKF